MAKTGAVWGIDLGQTALKALRCRAGAASDQIFVEAFDYIEYPKMLSSPDADPAALVKEALEQFLSRNSVAGDQVAISVSGQSGLARFIKLPPVESKKIPDIVRYEARQQIPFALEDVVWDYQQMAGGSMEEGFALETEVGLFAMKRDQVNRALRPFLDAGIAVDIVQLTPLALYNFVTFDQMPEIPPQDQYDPENPPASVVVMSLGTDVSDLVVTNGYKVWQRSINLGGNHFTKALTKQMKLTGAKAEHLKRNAMKAEDPKAVFQAMRPVFGELLGEVQRSLSFFQNLDRSAKLGRVVPLGNAMKLRGLHKYLAQNLGLEVAEFEKYQQLDGPAVLNAPKFKENLLSFSVCYGLAVQALGKGRLNTNLLPREIIKDRMIRAKKPWAVAAVATLLLGCLLGYLGHWREWNSARKDDNFERAFTQAESTKKLATDSDAEFEAAKTEFQKVHDLGLELAGIGEKRIQVAELFKAINDSLPPYDEKERQNSPADIAARNELHIESIDCEYYPDLKVWAEEYKKELADSQPAAPNQPQSQPNPTPTQPAPASGDPSTASAEPPATPPGPEGGGWVLQLAGHHYHNKNREGAEFVRKTLIKNLLDKKDVKLPGGTFSTRELGIGFPILAVSKALHKVTLTNQNLLAGNNAPQPPPAGGGGASGFLGAKAAVAAAGPATAAAATQVVDQYDFVVQFVWKPTTVTQRLEERQKQQNAANQQHDLATTDTTGKH
jgi:type IV pilus assembly protein PilM